MNREGEWTGDWIWLEVGLAVSTGKTECIYRLEEREKRGNMKGVDVIKVKRMSAKVRGHQVEETRP